MVIDAEAELDPTVHAADRLPSSDGAHDDEEDAAAGNDDNGNDDNDAEDDDADEKQRRQGDEADGDGDAQMEDE